MFRRRTLKRLFVFEIPLVGFLRIWPHSYYPYIFEFPEARCRFWVSLSDSLKPTCSSDFWNWYCLTENWFLHIKCKECSNFDCTSTLIFVLSNPKAVHVGMLLNFKECHKNNFDEYCLHLDVCLLSLLTFKIVLMTWMLALMKVYFSSLIAEWRIWIPKMLLNID